MSKFPGWPKDDYSFNAAEVGQAFAALVVREDGIPRVGMLGAGPTVTAVPASWKLEVSAFVYAHTVGRATQWSGESSAVQVDVTPATGIPAGQSRIDALVWDPVVAELSVLAGVPAVSPSPPAVGARALVAEYRVNAGDGIVIQEQVTPKFQFADRVLGKITTMNTGHAVTAATRLEIDSSGMADVYVEVTTSPGVIVSGGWAVTLPGGFAPESVQEVAAVASQGSSVAGACFVQIGTNRGITFWGVPSGAKKASFHHRYRVKR